jgi:hypothetical protein
MRSFLSTSQVSRRSLLSALSLGALFFGLPSWAKEKAKAKQGSHVKKVEKDKRGVTLYLELEKAPFPAPGSHYHDNTVIVFVPSFYRLPSSKNIDVVIHFHGHFSTAAAAMKSHQLREQVYDSKQNVVLVIPQGPVSAKDSSGGKLDQAKGLLNFLTDLRHTLQSAKARNSLGKSGFSSGSKIGKVCMSAHSGGFLVLANCLKHGGYNVNEVYLFDSLYGAVDQFRDWVVARKSQRGSRRHKLISYYAGTTVTQLNKQLMAALTKAGVAFENETKEGALTRKQITVAKAVFIKTNLSHTGVTHELNALRDCLFASSLKRRLKSNWFDNKNHHRKLDSRD